MLIDFTKFCAKATIRFFIVGFLYTALLFVVYDHADNAPELLQGIATGFDILCSAFAISTVIASAIVGGRYVGRKIAEAAYRKLFA